MMIFDKLKIKRYTRLAEQVMQKTQALLKEDISTYPQHTAELKQQLANGKTEKDIILDAYALVGAGATKVLHMTPYKVQIIGGLVLNENAIAEMHTGEGKTLTATMPMYLNALSGKGAHLVTANSYLAKRDAEQLKPLYNALGLSVGYTDEVDENIPHKQKAYRADITYTTASTIGFDYLRDNLAKNPQEIRQRGFNYVLLDEVDSILLDNANTPLIISGVGQPITDGYQKADAFVRYHLNPNSVIIEKDKHCVRLKPSGIMSAKEFYGEDLFENQRANVHYLTNALQAYYLYNNGKEYLTHFSKKDGIQTVELIDTNTGRILDGQRFSDEIHQALEAKENVLIHAPNSTYASITYQSLFSMYNKVAGMTGTAMTDKGELSSIYNLDVLPIPPNKKDQRVDLPDKIYASQKEKFQAVAQAILKYRDRKQPVLVGTASVVSSEKLSQLLDNYGIEHETLNANNPEYESKIVAQAGQPKAVTIATNMAGRGTDIKLGKGVEDLGGLVVIGTERHTSPRIDNQLRGRTARQGQKGITQFYISLEDDIFKQYKPNKLEQYVAKYQGHQGEIHNKHLDRLFKDAQYQLSDQNFENRKSDLTYESIIGDERERIYQQRKLFVTDDYDPKAFLQQTCQNVIDDYFKKFKKVKITHHLIREIQLKFIDKIFSESMITLGNTAYYNDISDIKRSIQDASFDELKARSTVLKDQLQPVIDHIALLVIDFYWGKEINYLTDAKRTITLESYRQANPYVEYQRTASASFHDMVVNIQQSILQIFYQTKFNIIQEEQGTVVNAHIDKPLDKLDYQSQLQLQDKQTREMKDCE